MKEKSGALSETEFFEAIHRRLHKENRNWVCCITGDTGSGKSYTALRIAEILDPGFGVGNIAFTPREFLQLVRYGKPDGNGGYIPLESGAFIIFDEAGVGMASRTWYTVQNQILGYLLQTFRYKNYGVIFTVPDFSFIDVQARKLFHNYIKSRGIDYKEQRVHTTIYLLDHNDWLNKTYRHTVNQDGDDYTFWAFAKPNDALIKEYEDKKRTYADTLYEQAIDTLDEMDNKKLSRGKRAEQMLRDGEDPLNVADTLGLSISTVNKRVRELQNAGAL